MATTTTATTLNISINLGTLDHTVAETLATVLKEAQDSPKFREIVALAVAAALGAAAHALKPGTPRAALPVSTVGKGARCADCSGALYKSPDKWTGTRSKLDPYAYCHKETCAQHNVKQEGTVAAAPALEVAPKADVDVAAAAAVEVAKAVEEVATPEAVEAVTASKPKTSKKKPAMLAAALAEVIKPTAPAKPVTTGVVVGGKSFAIALEEAGGVVRANDINGLAIGEGPNRDEALAAVRIDIAARMAAEELDGPAEEAPPPAKGDAYQKFLDGKKGKKGKAPKAGVARWNATALAALAEDAPEAPAAPPAAEAAPAKPAKDPKAAPSPIVAKTCAVIERALKAGKLPWEKPGAFTKNTVGVALTLLKEKEGMDAVNELIAKYELDTRLGIERVA